jgi:hypothetical protein
MTIPAQIEQVFLYYYLTAGTISAIKEAIFYRKVNKEFDSIFFALVLTCFFIGCILLPVQMYNWVWEKWNKKL